MNCSSSPSTTNGCGSGQCGVPTTRPSCGATPKVIECSKHVNRVVADRENRNILAAVFWQAALQLDELRLAERSPGRAAVEEHQRPATGAICVQVHHAPILSGQDNIGKQAANGRSDTIEIQNRRWWNRRG